VSFQEQIVAYPEERDVSRLKSLGGWFLAVGVAVAGAPVAEAEPLTPLGPSELQYLEQLHRVFAVSPDPMAFRSDGELLLRGRRVCYQRSQGFVGPAATSQPSALIQLAFIYLCPE
jgi:hypothetical protein